MTEVRPPFQLKKLLLASASLLLLMVVCFLTNTGHMWVIAVIVAGGLPAFFGYIVGLASHRSKGEGWVILSAMAIFFLTIAPASIGSHSLWLTVFGDTLHCKVVSIETHKSTRSPNTYSNTLDCAGRKIDYKPSIYLEVLEPGSTMDIVVDRTGFLAPLEPERVGLGFNLFLLAGVLVNAAFMLLVARLPARRPAAEAATKE